MPYCLMVGAFAWLGPTETAARLVSALSAVAVAVLTALIGTRLTSARVGLMAGLMVAANLEVFAWAGDRRVFLLSAATPAKSVMRELPAERVHLLADGGGRRLYSNRP